VYSSYSEAVQNQVRFAEQVGKPGDRAKQVRFGPQRSNFPGSDPPSGPDPQQQLPAWLTPLKRGNLPQRLQRALHRATQLSRAQVPADVTANHCEVVVVYFVRQRISIIRGTRHRPES